MKNTDIETILKLISDYSELYPELRFGQILFNLGVNEFEEEKIPTRGGVKILRDIHSDSSKKIKERVINNFLLRTLKFKENESGTLDIEDNVKLDDYKLEKIPFKINRVGGHFICSVKSLHNFPCYVDRDVILCDNTNFTEEDVRKICIVKGDVFV